MKGKSWSIPAGMILKKHYCPDCATKMKKEKIHRVVGEDDHDYYQYQDYMSFPRYNYDVYNYRFKCPKCSKRVSYEEQVIINKIQKLYHKKILSNEEIKNSYDYFYYRNIKRHLYTGIISGIIGIALFCMILFFSSSDRSLPKLLISIGIFIILAPICIIRFIRSFYGKNTLKRNRGYSFEKIAKFERLHTYASNNQKLIEESENCYCFHCNKKLKATDIEKYIDNNQTALCPHCLSTSIIPDNIPEHMDSAINEEMHKYWF